MTVRTSKFYPSSHLPSPPQQRSFHTLSCLSLQFSYVLIPLCHSHPPLSIAAKREKRPLRQMKFKNSKWHLAATSTPSLAFPFYRRSFQIRCRGGKKCHHRSAGTIGDHRLHWHLPCIDATDKAIFTAAALWAWAQENDMIISIQLRFYCSNNIYSQ